MKYIFFLLLLSFSLKAQVINKTDGNQIKDDTLVVDNGRKDSLKIFRPTIADYKWKTQFREPQVFDTTFTIARAYRYTQYNNRDNFGRIQFANIGSGFQDLVFNIDPKKNLTVLPTRKSYFIIGSDEVKYYDVKTPTTSFAYHSAMRNGAALHTTYTQNFGKNLNVAVEYMGLRSQGFYTNSLAASNTTQFSAHYLTGNKKYEAYAHFIHQNVNNKENGGIKDLSLFTGGDSRFNNRLNLEVNLNASNSRFSARRFYFSQGFRPFASEKFPFKIRHTIYQQQNKYHFNIEGNDLAAFGTDVDAKRDPSSKKESTDFTNIISLIFDNERFNLDAGFQYQNLKLGYKDTGAAGFPDVYRADNRIGAVGNLGINLLDKFAVKSHLEYSVGREFGSYLRSENNVKFEPIKDYFVDADVNFQSASPTFNWLVNSSAVLKANYDIRDFKNESSLEISGMAGLKWFGSQVFAKYIRIDNYAFFDSKSQPQQSDTSLNISQIGGEATVDYRKFHLNTRLLFQQMLSNKNLYPAPNLVGRANFYWQDKFFKNAAELMAGLKVYYFTKFNSREFSPMLNEFILAGAHGYAIGGRPIADVYVNMKVKTMQVFLEGQNFTTLFMPNRNYTAPYYPIYDFRLNISIVWNLFN